MMMPQDVTDSYISVGQFFSERSVFVTGGTGFLGKVLVEKLLRSCPGIKVIYLLIRPKKGLDLSARLADVTNSRLFERIKEEDPSVLNKIVPICGDVILPELGISQSDQDLLARTVSVVFHSAATTNFNEPLKVAVQINMLGTKRVIDLCHKMQDLKALVHVSTCYCNCDREQIEEFVYPPPCDPEMVVQCTEWMNDELLAHLTPKLLGKQPNTYMFTKTLTESMVLKESSSLPIAIVRPSIVTSSWCEPVPGWIESVSVPTWMIAAYSRGILRTVPAKGSMVTDLVPVDMVVNVMVCAAWWIATARPNSLTVYNCCTGENNPITFKEYSGNVITQVRKHPLGDVMWYPGGSIQSNRIMHRIHVMLLHVIPAYLADAFLKISGKKPIMVRIQSKVRSGCEAIHYFMNRDWRFRGENLQHLMKSLSDEDRNKFQFDVRDIDWMSYLESYVLGIRTFLNKEDPSTLPQARKRMTRLFWTHRCVQIVGLLAVGYVIFGLLVLLSRT